MTAVPSTELNRLLADLSTAVNREHRRGRRRRSLAMAAVAAVICTAGVGVAGTYADWWTNATPPVNPKQVASDIEENTFGSIAPDPRRKATVATTADAALVAVATKSGGYCLIPSLDDRPDLGNSCTSSADSELRSYSSPPGVRTPHWIAFGRIIEPRAAALDLSALGLAQPVRLERGGFFLFDLPHEQWSALDDRHGPIRVLDGSGGVVSTGCVWLGPAPGSRGAGDRWGVLGGPGDSCDQHVPKPVVVEVAQARKLVELTLSDAYSIYRPGDSIAVWEAPSADGSTCYFLGLADAQPTSPNGPDCRAQAARFSAGRPIEVTSGATLVDGDRYANLVTGEVASGSGIVRLELESQGGAKDVAFAGGAFLVEPPDSPRVGRGPVPFPGAPYTIVGYDAHGNRVAAVNLDGSPAP